MRIAARTILSLSFTTAALAATTPLATAAACPNESLRYGYGANLPDCRAYEQATPIEKDGTNPQSTYQSVQAATGGGGVTFFTQSGVPGGTGAGNTPSFLARREAGGWVTKGLLPPGKTGQFAGSAAGWTPDLAEAFGSETQLEPFSTAFVATDMVSGSVRTIVSSEEAPTYRFVGASSDGELVFFEAIKAALTPEVVSKKDNLYVWDRSSGAIRLVGVLPDSACGSPPCAAEFGSFGGAYNWWYGEEPNTGGTNSAYFTQVQNAISADGQKAYFTASGTGQIYLREDAAGASAVTRQVSASQKTNGSGPGGTDANGPKPAALMMATSDGSQALFTSSEEMTNDANTGTDDEGNELYRYEPESGALTDLTPDLTDPNGAEVRGVLGASEDGSYVYFVANGDLDGSGPATKGDCVGNDYWTGECSLYLWHGNKIDFVARLNTSGAAEVEGDSDAADWAPRSRTNAGLPVIRTSRVSGSGRILLFRSRNKLTTYENHGVPEFYRYDAQTGEVNCVSCDPSGAAPSGQPMLQRQTSFLSPASLAPIETRVLSSSGDQFFFETSGSLLPADTNGVSDVYEWEANGAGSCASAADGGGCLYLLSTGTSPDPSHLADASASGNDAFFFTDQSLVGQDQDELIDIYDVHVDGGLSSQNPPVRSACVGEECRLPLGAPPSSPFVSSVTFSGQSNQVRFRTPSVKASTVRRTVHRTVRSDGFSVSVSAPGKGQITISGAGVTTVGRLVSGAGTYRVRVQLTGSKKRLLARRHRLRLTLRIAYVPAAASSGRGGK